LLSETIAVFRVAEESAVTTISTSTTLGIDLNHASYTNPVVIEPGVTILNFLNSPWAVYISGSAYFFTIQNGGTISDSDVGVYLAPGGSVTNAAGALITGVSDGVDILGGAGTVVNDGSIAGTSDIGIGRAGVVLGAGGSVTNAASASITGGDYGVYISGGAGTVVNDGSIAGTYTSESVAGVGMVAGGSVTNSASGSISSGFAGVDIRGGAGTVVNAGGIAGDSFGVYVYSDASVTNAPSASITGGTLAVDLFNGGTLRTAGTIVGSGGTAVSFGGTGSNLLVLEPGFGFSGKVIGSTSASDTLELASASGAGTLTDLGEFSTNLDLVVVDSGASWNLTGATLLDAGGLVNDGQIVLDPSTLLVASLTGTGSITIGTGSTLIVQGTVSGGETIVFAGSGGVLDLGDSAGMAGTIVGYVSGDATNTGPGTVANNGTIAGISGYGVLLGTGGLVTNAAFASITGTYIGVFISGTGTVVNDGSIAGTTRYGIDLRSGGSITNAASASIAGFMNGVNVSGGAGTVVNDGSIASTSTSFSYGVVLSYGVILRAGGSVTNAASASIMGGITGKGVEISGAAGTVVNDGSIAHGVYLTSGGSVTNAASASITADGDGVVITGGGATVVNDGSIGGAGAFGIALDAGGSVTNAVSASIMGGLASVGLLNGGTLTNAGSITGFYGVELFSGGTLTNAGAIIASSGTAVAFGGTGSNLLVLDPGYGFSGLVSGSASANNTLELAGTSAGTVAGLGTQFTNFGPVVFDPGAEWSISGSTSGLSGAIDGFTAADTIVLTGVTATGSSYVGGILTLDETVGSATLDLPGTFSSAASFNVTNNSNGAEVTVACFLAGTRLLTVAGEAAVEALAPDDVLVTRSGRTRPVRWIGHRHVDCTRHPKPGDVWPVRVRTGAFGTSIPHRDLWLSPDHAVFINGVLIPIRYLVNGRTIVQEPVDQVTYYHVELSCHDVILAEGLPCESYLDTGNRGAFANGGDAGDGEGAAPTMLHPDFALKAWKTKACAELVVDGPKLAATKSALLAQAEALGHRMTSDPDLSVVVDGHTLRPKIAGKTWRVNLPPTVRGVRLVSRTWVPAHTRAAETDTRLLGVAVSRLWLDGREVSLDSPGLVSGWHAAEPADSADAAAKWRWTHGDAGLALAGVRELAFDAVMTGSYWEAPAAYMLQAGIVELPGLAERPAPRQPGLPSRT
jgi:hypothetical protein